MLCGMAIDGAACLVTRPLSRRRSISRPPAEWTARLGVTRVAETADVVPPSVLVLTTARAPHDGHLALYRQGVAYAVLTVVKTSLELPLEDDPQAMAAAVADGSGAAGRPLLPAEARSGAVTRALLRAAAADYATAVALAADGVLHAAHIAAWEADVWSAGVEVAGRPDVAAVANASLYSLASYLRPDWPFGSSPGGLSAPGYNGCVRRGSAGNGLQRAGGTAMAFHTRVYALLARHRRRPSPNPARRSLHTPPPFPSRPRRRHQFWDHDTFTQPVWTLLQPSLAQSTVLYRLHRLPGARAKAASYPNGGYRGAMFPWGACMRCLGGGGNNAMRRLFVRWRRNRSGRESP